MRRRLGIAAIVVTIAVTFADHGLARQSAAVATAGLGLRVKGDVTTPLSLTMADLKTMPRKTVQAKDASGTVTTYEGVLVGEILKRAGLPMGDLRGNVLATYVIASAPDGYWVVFSLAELDPAMAANDIIVADTVDGKPLADGQGPLKMIVPKDSRPARSVKMLEYLDVVRLRKS